MTVPGDMGVVVLTHGSVGEYPPLISALAEQGVPAQAMVIVHNPTTPVDPAPEPPLPGVTVLRMEQNLGYAGGMNAGIRHQLEQGARLVLLLTHEVRLRPGAIAALRGALERAPDVGVVGPVLWARGEDTIFSGGGRRGRRGGWVTHIKERPPATREGIAECDWVDGAAVLVRREVLEGVGLIDEGFFLYFEETDLCLRATKAGWRVGVALDAAAEQESGQPARPGLHAYLISRNGFEYARRASGVLGVAATVRRALVESWQLLREYPRAAEEPRARTRVKLKGMWLGFADFLRRRFGPPPERVQTWDLLR